LVGDKLTSHAAERHPGTSGDQGRESLAVRSNEFTALARVLLGLVEVKYKVFVLGKESKAIDSAGKSMLAKGK
jgi:hypothetical protein